MNQMLLIGFIISILGCKFWFYKRTLNYLLNSDTAMCHYVLNQNIKMYN
jgi:hypothetical protein